MTLAQTWKQQKDKAEKILADAKKSGIEKTGQFQDSKTTSKEFGQTGQGGRRRPEGSAIGEEISLGEMKVESEACQKIPSTIATFQRSRPRKTGEVHESQYKDRGCLTTSGERPQCDRKAVGIDGSKKAKGLLQASRRRIEEPSTDSRSPPVKRRRNSIRQILHGVGRRQCFTYHFL